MASAYKLHFAIAAAGRTGQDRVEIIERADGVIVVVADGAGGIGDGSRAAEFVVDKVRASAAGPIENHNGLFWQDALMRIDRELSAAAIGESTAVVIVLTQNGLMGASVGDSQAWLIDGANVDALTVRRQRKPLVGHGGAMPNPFERLHRRRKLIVGSDGLFNDVAFERIIQIAKITPPKAAASAMIDAARLQSGKLQHDICVVIASPSDANLVD